MTVLAGFIAEATPDPVLDGNLTRSKAQSLIECAVLSYKKREEVAKAVGWKEKGEPEGKEEKLLRFEWFEAVGRTFDSQGFACVVRGPAPSAVVHVILAFRGTKQIRDFLTDALIIKKPLKDFNGEVANDLGLVHYGFQHSLDSLWSDSRKARRNAISTIGKPIDQFLREVYQQYVASAVSVDQPSPESQLWLTGHSLGAALATIAAARIRLTDGAPFKDSIGGLVTIGSPRALDNQAADKLRQSLESAKICRIHRSIDPVPAVPYWGFRHVSGRKAFVTKQGNLVMGARKSRRWADRFAAWLRTLEDSIGSALPGQHRGFAGFVSDHASEDYLKAVQYYKETNRLRIRDSAIPIVVPLSKLLGAVVAGWTAAQTTGVSEVATTIVQVLRAGAETIVALIL